MRNGLIEAAGTLKLSFEYTPVTYTGYISRKGRVKLSTAGFGLAGPCDLHNWGFCDLMRDCLGNLEDQM